MNNQNLTPEYGIVIISENRDKSTDLVIDWLHMLKIPHYRYNSLDPANVTIGISNEDLRITIGKKEIKKIWIRRGRFHFIPVELRFNNFSSYLKNEERPIVEFCEKMFYEEDKVIGSYQEETLNNKLLNLYIAKKSGLDIPNTLITNQKKDILDFKTKSKKVITKCIFHPPNLDVEDFEIHSVGTIIIEKEQIEFLDDSFAPTLFQEYIEKKYEVRVFFFGNNFYSMAIFSQRDKKTMVDFRNYNNEKPNRNVPLTLPSHILSKIKKFIKLKGINTGSIDFIVTNNDRFVFLEINPQGQFNWLSENCNYYIEKDIAFILKDSL